MQVYNHYGAQGKYMITSGFMELVQDPARGLVEPHEVHMGPLLELVKVPLDDILSFMHVNHTTLLGVICRLAEGVVNPTVCVNDEDIKQYCSQYGP